MFSHFILLQLQLFEVYLNCKVISHMVSKYYGKLLFAVFCSHSDSYDVVEPRKLNVANELLIDISLVFEFAE